MTHENYYSADMDQVYFSSSQIRNFIECEARAVALAKGEFNYPVSEAMLVGSYFETLLTDEHEAFQAEHPEMFRQGTKDLTDRTKMLKPFQHAWTMHEAVRESKLWMSFVENGENQKIITGTIAGVSFKGMIDVYKAGQYLVDIKTTRSFGKVWSNSHGTYTSFARAYDYDIQGAIYRELIRKETGERLPFYLAAVTKETVPDYAVFEIDPNDLDDALEFIKLNAERYQLIKSGVFEPTRCEACDYCKLTRKDTVERVRDWKEFKG